jgi:hypothetical protein
MSRFIGTAALAAMLAIGCGNERGLSKTSPSASLSQASLDFGAVEELTSKTLAVPVENRGLAALHLTAKIGPLSSPDFEVGAVPAEIASGETGSVAVTFRPVGSGSDSGTLVLGTDDPDKAEIEIALNGGPIAPALSASPDPVDFKTGHLTSAAVTLKNEGLASLKIQTLAVGGNSDFSVEPPALPRTLKPGEQVEVTVAYAKSAKTADGTLTIGSDDPASPRSVRLIPDPGAANPDACAWSPLASADANESNNSISAPNPTVATVAGANTYSYNITLNSGDEDWVRLNIPSSGSNTTARGEITCLNWAGAGCGGGAPTVQLDLWYTDDVSNGITGPQHDGTNDGKSGKAVVTNSGSINSLFSGQRWYIAAKPSATVCSGEYINATLKITVTNN